MSQIFDTLFGRTDTVTRARHGMLWETAEEDRLEKMFRSGDSLSKMCITLERGAVGVIARLNSRSLVRFDASTLKYYVNVVGGRATQATNTPEPETLIKETTMSAPTIETKTFIAGTDATHLSDADIFKKIAQLENEIKTMNAINSKPKKLLKVIEDTQADIDKLVAFVDARP